MSDVPHILIVRSWLTGKELLRVPMDEAVRAAAYRNIESNHPHVFQWHPQHEAASLQKDILEGVFDLGNGDNFRFLELTGVVIPYANLEHWWMGWVNLSRANLSDANLNFATLNGSILEDAVLRRATLCGASLEYTRLARADFRGAVLYGSHLNFGVDLTDADLSGADLRGTDLFDARLPNARLIRANLRGWALQNDLTGCDLSYANLLGTHVESTGGDPRRVDKALYNDDTELIGWLDGQRASMIYVASNSDLSEADLNGQDLRALDLTNANLRAASLSGANLTRSCLAGANLTDAILLCANLEGSNLEGASLLRAEASGALLAGVKLRDAYLRGAHFRNCDFGECELKGAWYNSKTFLSGSSLDILAERGAIEVD